MDIGTCSSTRYPRLTDPNETGLQTILLNKPGILVRRGRELIDDDGGETEAHACSHGRKARYHGAHGHHTPPVRTVRVLHLPGVVGLFTILSDAIIGGVAISRQEQISGCDGSVYGLIHGLLSFRMGRRMTTEGASPLERLLDYKGRGDNKN